MRIFVATLVIFSCFVMTPPASAQNVISGQALEITSKGEISPLSSLNDGLQVVLKKIEPWGKQWLNQTDCWWKIEGCADQYGQYRFTVDISGNPLPKGEYEIVATSWGRTISRQRFYLDGVVEVRNELPRSCVWFDQRNQSPYYLPSKGGKIWVSGLLWKADTCVGEGSTIKTTASVQGPMRTTERGQYDISLADITLPTQQWDSVEVTFAVVIDGDLPDDEPYCANIRLGPLNNPVFDSIWACGIKTDNPPVWGF